MTSRFVRTRAMVVPTGNELQRQAETVIEKYRANLHMLSDADKTRQRRDEVIARYAAMLELAQNPRQNGSVASQPDSAARSTAQSTQVAATPAASSEPSAEQAQPSSSPSQAAAAPTQADSSIAAPQADASKDAPPSDPAAPAATDLTAAAATKPTGPLELKIEKKFHGALVGKGGSVIKQLQQDSGAQIKLDGDNGVVTVTGTDEAIAKAKTAIIAIVGPSALPGAKSESLVVDPKKMGAIVGPGGSVLAKIKADSGADVVVPREGNTVTITGSDEAIASAKLAILLLVDPAAAGQNKVVLNIVQEKHGWIVGPAGSILQQIQTDSGATITMPTDGGCDVVITGPTTEAVAKAQSSIEEICSKLTSDEKTAANEAAFQKFQVEVEEAVARRTEYFDKATALQESGDKAGAAEWREKAKEQTAVMEAAQEKAAGLIFANVNEGRDNDLSIDLHGQRVDAALKLMHSHLERVAKDTSKLPVVEGKKQFHVITGAGHHSGEAGVKIRPAVLKDLSEKGYAYVETADGGGVHVLF